MKVTLEDWAVDGKLNSISTDYGLGMFASEEMGRGMNPYVPMDTGILSSFYLTTPFMVTYMALYAKINFEGEGRNFSHEKHPKATAHWDRAYAAAHGQDLATSLEGYIRRM